MARPLRVQYPHAVYHIMNRGLARQSIFLTEKDYLTFLKTLQEAWQQWKFELFAYCLMNNHYHICLRTPEAKLSRIMRHINGVYTQRFNRSNRLDGPLFRGRYKAMLIEEEEYLGNVVRYIHLNPVEANLAKRPQDYRWSSHRDYLSRKKPLWLSINPLMDWFGTARSFHEFVLEGNEKPISQLYRKGRWPVILGTEAFIERVRGVARPAKEHLREEVEFVRPSTQKIMEAVAGEFRVPLRRLVESRRGEENKGRKVALWALKEFGDCTHGEAARIIGLGSARTAGWACHQIRKEAQHKRNLRAQLKRIEQRISQQKT